MRLPWSRGCPSWAWHMGSKNVIVLWLLCVLVHIQWMIYWPFPYIHHIEMEEVWNIHFDYWPVYPHKFLYLSSLIKRVEQKTEVSISLFNLTFALLYFDRCILSKHRLTGCPVSFKLLAFKLSALNCQHLNCHLLNYARIACTLCSVILCVLVKVLAHGTHQ